MFRGVMDLQLFNQPSGHWSFKGLIQGREDMGIQVIHDQDDFFGLSIVPIDEFLHEDGPIFLGSPLTDFHITFACPGFTSDKETTDPLPLILIILTFGFPLFSWNGFAHGMRNEISSRTAEGEERSEKKGEEEDAEMFVDGRGISSQQ